MMLQVVPDWNTLTILAGTATFSAAAGFAVSRQIANQGKEYATSLAALGEKFMTALTEHKEEDAQKFHDVGEKFHDHALRLGRIDLMLEGSTHSGKNPDRMDPKAHR